MAAKRGKLPACVYYNHGAYYHVKNNKWTRLGKTESEMYKALSALEYGNAKRGMMLLFERYERDILAKKKDKLKYEQQKQMVLLKEVFGKMEPGAITPPQIAQYLDKRAETAPVAGNREIALLSHVFKSAIRWGIVTINPCKGIERNKEKKRERYVQDWELEVVYRKAPQHMQIFMDLAYLTGQRQGDILNIKLSDIGDDGISFVQAKTGAKLCVVWSDALKAVVDRAKRLERKVKSMYLMSTDKGRPYTSSGIQTAWQRLMVDCIKAEVIKERFTFHDLRAKARSDGDDKHLLGHQNPDAMAKTYQRKAIKVRPVK